MLIKYSGAISMFVAWIFIVIPTLAGRLDHKLETISRITHRKIYLYTVNTGLITGAILQLVFLLFLINKFNLSRLSPFAVAYFSTVVATILVVVFPHHKQKVKHTIAVRYYFVVIPISLMLFSLSLTNTHKFLSLVSNLISTSYAGGVLYIIKKYGIKNSLIEMWAFLQLSIWTIMVTYL